MRHDNHRRYPSTSASRRTMPVGGGRVRSKSGGAGNPAAAAVTPERPKYLRKGEERPPGHYRPRPSNMGLATTPQIYTALPSSSPSSTQHSAGSGYGASGSGAKSRNPPHEEGGVRVVVRVRPLGEEEAARGAERTMRCCNPRSLEFLNTPAVAVSGISASAEDGLNSDGVGCGGGGGGGGGEGRREYTFDLCAHEGFTQEEMFRSCGLMPLLSAAIDGYAGTVFAYGATGAGKTYTMSGHEQVVQGGPGPNGRPRGRTRGPSGGGRGGHETEGLIPRSMRYLFERISALPYGVTMRIRASFYEIYNEVVYDLLTQDDRRPLQVRYDARRGFFVQGLFEVEIRGLSDIMAVVDEGNGNRRVSSHLLNKDSSRSHSLLTVYLQNERKDSEDGHLVRTFGKVSFVDLAGSERLKKSKALNEKETTSINKSLLTLGKVISALSKRSSAASAAAPTNASAPAESGTSGVSDTQSSSVEDNSPRSRAVAADQSDSWVPYRDSTLTKLLMDSLGGFGLTLMVACVSPSARHTEESAATLNYAARTRNIRSRPLVRVDARERLMNALRREVGLLREENDLLRKGNIAPTASVAVVGSAATAADGGGDGSGGKNVGPQRRIEPFTTPIKPHVVPGGRTGGDFSAGPAGPSAAAAVAPRVLTVRGGTPKQPEEGGTVGIGQASRDVTALLRKYEGECHRLRHEAALAQHKELEIGKQTRQALVENDALCRTVERLQKSFATHKTLSQPLAPGKRNRKDEKRVPASLGVEKGVPPQKPWSSLDGASPAASSPGGMAAAIAEADLGYEVMHLRQVNEALVERIESMERRLLKTAINRGSGGGAGGGGGGGDGGGGGGGGSVFDKSAAKMAKITAATPPAAAKKVTQQAENRTGAAAAAPATATARPSGLRRAVKPASSTNHRKIPRARAGIALKKQALRRDPRGRILLRGSPGFESAGEKRVPTVEPPPGRLVGSVDRVARPRERPFIGETDTTSNARRADRGYIGQAGGGGNGVDPDGARFGGTKTVGADEPPPKEGGASVTIEQVETQQHQRTTPLAEEENVSARRIGGGGGVGEGGAQGSTMAFTADGGGGRGATKTVRAPSEEIEAQQAREHAQQQERERQRDGDASDTEEDESPAEQPHQQDVSGDWGEYGRRRTNQSHSDTDESPPATEADRSGEVGEEALRTVPPDEPNHEKENAGEVVAAALGSSVAPASGGG